MLNHVVWVGGLDYTTQLLYRDSIPAIIRLPLKPPFLKLQRFWLQDSGKVLDFAGTAQPGGEVSRKVRGICPGDSRDAGDLCVLFKGRGEWFE